MSDIEELELNVKTLLDLEKCGVTSGRELADLHLLEVLGAGAGLRVLEDARRGQLEYAGIDREPTVDWEEIEGEVACGEVGSELIDQCESRLESDGWSFDQESKRWKYWNKETGAVNWLKLFDQRALVYLGLTQGHSGMHLYFAPGRSAEAVGEFVDRIRSMSDELSFEQRSELFDRVRPSIQEAWVQTREGYIPTAPVQ